MNSIDWKRKLTSRKFWVAIAAFISGLILAFGGTEGTASTVSGVILQGAAVIGYLLAEGLTDAANKESNVLSIPLEEIDIEKTLKDATANDTTYPSDNYGGNGNE